MYNYCLALRKDEIINLKKNPYIPNLELVNIF